MRLPRLCLILSVLVACTGGVSSPPPGQPSAPQRLPRSTPPATTLEETEAELRRDLGRTKPGDPAGSFVTVYYVHDRLGVDLLTDWFRRQEAVAAVRTHESGSRTRAQGAGSRQAGAIYVAEDEWWELEVESPVKVLAPADVTSWIRLLQAVPADTRWQLGPSVVARPGRRS